MWQAEIVTPRVVVDGVNVAKVSQDYAHLFGADVTGQPARNIPTDPNLLVVRVLCEADVLEAIEADGEYLVLWSEEVVEDAAS